MCCQPNRSSYSFRLLDVFYRLARGADAGSDSEESSEEESKSESGSGSEDESSSDDENKKKKGVSGLIEIENPNRARRKAVAKVPAEATVAGPSATAKPELSRREREELEKQRATAKYQKMHSEGKTDEARADLARLAIIKQNRAEAQARRESEKKGKPWRHHINYLIPTINSYIAFAFAEKDDKKKPGTK